MVHQSAAKKRIIFGLTIFFLLLFAGNEKKQGCVASEPLPVMQLSFVYSKIDAK